MVLYGKPHSIYLLDIHSHPFHSIADQLFPLEIPQHLHATHSSTGGTLIELPRMRLSFFINSDMQLESNNLHGQVVDRHQSSGTMFGLRNQLLLCAKDPAALKLPQSRTVLIPHGEIAFKSVGDHVAVTIDSGSHRQVEFHQFKVDRDLQYLASTTGLTSRLFKIYLHAITSHCLPDPLTGRTGTEEALHELSRAATLSFDQIDETQAQLLKLIDSLTPAREYYPPHLRTMQTTHWANLPTLSQHYAFHASSKAILDRADTLRLFHPLSFDLAAYMRDLEPGLLERNARRTWFYYPEDTTSSSPSQVDVTKTNDRKYVGRDSISSEWALKGDVARWASGLAYYRWHISTFVPCALVSTLESWGHVGGLSNDLALNYSPAWLHVDIAASWISIFNLCRQAHLVGNRYSLATCLASAVYGGGLPENLLLVLVAVASASQFANRAPPTHTSYQMIDGYQPTADRIRLIVSNLARSLEDSPAKNLPLIQGESSSKHMIRRRNHYDSNVLALTTKFTDDLITRWPNSQLKSVGQTYSSWFNIDKCLEKVERYFSGCAKNLELRSHLEKLEDQLSSQPATANLNFLPATKSAHTEPNPGTRFPSKSSSPILLSGLMHTRVSPGSANFLLQGNLQVKRHDAIVPNTAPLATLLAELVADSSQPLRQRYGHDLEKSRQDLLSKTTLLLASQLPPASMLDRNRNRCLEELSEVYTNIQQSLEPKTRAERITSSAGIWPRITPRTLFDRLSLRTRASTSLSWLEELVVFAQTFINYQRAQRLVGLALGDKREEFFKELEYGAGAVAPESYDPDWLLIQVCRFQFHLGKG